jgi:hypothetical protein
MMKKAKFRSLFLLPLFMVFLAACQGPVAPSPFQQGGAQYLNVSLGSGTVVLSFALPPGVSWTGQGARVVDPNTAFVYLWFKGTEVGSLALGSGVRDGGTWTGTFQGVPVGTFAPGEIVVKLVAPDGSLLAAGTNGVSCEVVKDQSAVVDITPKPAETLVTDITFGQKFEVNIPSGSTKYYRLRNLNEYTNFAGAIYHPLGTAMVAVFDQNGTLLLDERGKPAATIVAGPQTDMYRGWNSFPDTGDLYFGVFSQAIDGEPFTGEGIIYDKTRNLEGTFYGYEAKDYPNDFGRWTITPGGTVEVVVPPGMYMGYTFRFQNTSSENPGIVFPARRPVELSDVDPRISMEWQDDFGTVLWGGNDFGFRLGVDTGDKRFPSTLAMGATGSVKVRIPNDASPGGAFTFTFKYTVGEGSGFANVRYKGRPVPDGAVIDVGTFAPGWQPSLPFSINNNTHAILHLSNGVIEPAGSPLQGNNLPNATTDSATFYPWNGTGGALRLDLSGRTSADIGKVESAKVSFDTNDPTRPKISFTVKWTIGHPPMKFHVFAPKADPKSSLKLVYDNPSARNFSPLLGYRIMRGLSWNGPFTTVKEFPPSGSTDAELVYVDTGLALDTAYYYKVIATVGTAADPAGQVNTADWVNRAATFDPARIDAFKTTNGALTDKENPHPIPVDTLVNPVVYPKLYTDVLSFVPVPGTTYVVTVANKDMIDALKFTLWYASPNKDSYADRGEWRWVNSWDRQAQSIVWTCPADYPVGQNPWIMVNPNEKTSGSYTVYVRSVPKSPALLGKWNFNNGDLAPVAGSVFGAGKAADLMMVPDHNGTALSALHTDGQYSHITLANYDIPASILGSGPKFVGLWFKPDGPRNCIVYMGPQSNQEDGEGVTMRFITDNDGNLGIDRSWGTWWSNTKVDVGQWNYVYAGFDGYKWYVGKVSAGKAITTMLKDSGPSFLRQGKIILSQEICNGWYSTGAYDSLVIMDGKPSDSAIEAMAQSIEGQGIIQVDLQ